MKDINGISWLRIDYVTLSMARERMAMQCPVSASIKLSMTPSDHDPYLEQFEWNQAKARIQEAEQRRQQEAPIHHKVISKPVPSYDQLVQQHQQQN